MDVEPRLPPHLEKRSRDMDSDDSENEKQISEICTGPKLPPHLLEKQVDTRTQEEAYGPVLPGSDTGPCLMPHLRNKADNKEREESYGPAVPQSSVVGPVLPPPSKEQLRQESKVGDSSKEEAEDDSYGPALPPGFTKSKETLRSTGTKVGLIGPSIHGMDRTGTQTVEDEDDSSEEDLGNVIGPVPSSLSESELSIAITRADIEARAQATKDKILGKNKKKKKREQWMTELPPELSKNFGLGPRKFRGRAAECGDRSAWTDSPAEKARKLAEGDSTKPKTDADESDTYRAPWQEAKDKHMENVIESYTKHNRGESLLQQHQKEMKKEQKEEGDKTAERRPFDRDRDLAGLSMDPSKRKSLIKKSQELGSRFQRAKKSSTYL